MEPQPTCRLYTETWAKASRDAETRRDGPSSEYQAEYADRMATPSKVGKIDVNASTEDIVTPLKLLSLSKVLSSTSSAKFSSRGYPKSILAEHNITFLEGASISSLPREFATFPWLIFAKELPADRKRFSAHQLDGIEKELAASQDYKVVWLDGGAKHLLTTKDNLDGFGANWEIEDTLTDERADLLKLFLKRIGEKKHLGRTSEDVVNLPIKGLCQDLFFVCSGNNHPMCNPLYEGPLDCDHIKPDFVAGPFYQVDKKKVVSTLGFPSLLEVAELLSSFETVPGTTVHPLPFITGELKKENKPYCAEDGYKVMVEMLIIRLALDALFENPPQYTFGFLQAHQEWRIFAMTKGSEGYIIAEVFYANDSKVLDRLYIGTVFLRLATYILWQWQGLRLVSKEKQEEYRELFRKTKREKPTDHKQETNHRDDDDDTDGDDKGDGDSDDEGPNRKESMPKSEKSSAQVIQGSNSNRHNLSHVRKLKDNIFSAEYEGKECIVKVGQTKKIQREYRRYEELKGSSYMAQLFSAHVLDDTRALLVLKQYKPLPIAETAADLLRTTRQLLTALADLHGRGLVHCDIKNGNIVWDETTNSIKLIDFETCLNLPSGSFFKVYYGTHLFKAPELLEERWCSEKVDVFSAGLVCATMMYGGQIHSPEAREAVLGLINASHAPAQYAAFIPLFKSMLAAAPEERISARDALIVLNTLEKEQSGTTNAQQRVAKGVSGDRNAVAKPTKPLPSSVPVHDDKENRTVVAKPKKLTQPPRQPLQSIINSSRVQKQ